MITLKIIPFSKVERALAEKKQSLQEQVQCYNTNFHSEAEISAALPKIHHYPPEDQPWILFEPWSDLIMTSQRLSSSEVHRIELPKTFLNQATHASRLGLYMGRLSVSDTEDLADLFPVTTTEGLSVEDVLQRRRLFARLDTCSLKDALIGEGPIKDVRDIWTRLATSARAVAGIRDLRAHDDAKPIYLYLFPWKDEMKTEHEYRVFCAPEKGKISAISQYKWNAPWYHANRPKCEQEDIARRIFIRCRELHRRIMDHSAMTEDLNKRGFVFDVVEDPQNQSVQLIELNDFGAMSGCGACLFHWIKDARVVYGFEDWAEFRVAAWV